MVLKLVTAEQRVPETIRCLKQVAADIDTVFALSVLSHVGKDGSTITERAAIESGVTPAVNCKTNVGLRQFARKYTLKAGMSPGIQTKPQDES